MHSRETARRLFVPLLCVSLIGLSAPARTLAADQLIFGKLATPWSPHRLTGAR